MRAARCSQRSQGGTTSAAFWKSAQSWIIFYNERHEKYIFETYKLIWKYFMQVFFHFCLMWIFILVFLYYWLFRPMKNMCAWLQYTIHEVPFMRYHFHFYLKYSIFPLNDFKDTVWAPLWAYVSKLLSWGKGKKQTDTLTWKIKSPWWKYSCSTYWVKSISLSSLLICTHPPLEYF